MSDSSDTPPPDDRELADTCSTCGTRLMFGERRRGHGLCSPCEVHKHVDTAQRDVHPLTAGDSKPINDWGTALQVPRKGATPGTDGLADRCRAAGIELSLILEILASPEGRAAIAECMSRPPMRQPDGTWREPAPGSEARPGDWVRRTGGGPPMDSATWRRMSRIDSDTVLVMDGPVRYSKWPLAETELVQQAEGRAWPTRIKPAERP